jgi:NAD(P)-dependent dehydrogenase (short-subunit alcohol dehydrogenase family)
MTIKHAEIGHKNQLIFRNGENTGVLLSNLQELVCYCSEPHRWEQTWFFKKCLMQYLQNKNILITGASSGLGKAIVEELASEDVVISVVGRNKEKLALFDKLNVQTIYGDVTDESLINKVVSDLKPQIMILNAGATPIMGSLDEQTWDSFSRVWETDVKAGLYGIQAALKAPLPPGSRVLIVSSGAAMVGAPLSGSYAGAKRMLWLMGQHANEIAQNKGLDITFQTVVLMQMIAETDFAQTIAAAYAKPKGLSVENYIAERYGDPITATEYAKHVHALLTDPAFIGAGAYGIRKDTGIKIINY